MNLRTAAMLSPAIWAGVVLGISFVAQPAKFGAPGLSRATALSVGRRIFRAMHWVEAILGLGTIILAINGAPDKVYLVLLAVAILMVQIVWLMPQLSTRVDAILSGIPVNRSAHHFIFAVLEFVKLVLLIVFSLTV